VPTKTLYKPSSAAAAKRASAVLELRDTSRLSIALAEAAADELTRNGAFARHVREIYDRLPEKAPRVPREDPLRALKINLIPLRPDANYQVNPQGQSIRTTYSSISVPTSLQTRLSFFRCNVFRRLRRKFRQSTLVLSPKTVGRSRQ
jgi:hypothetical protein